MLMVSSIQHGYRPVQLVTYFLKALTNGPNVQPTHTSCALPACQPVLSQH